MALSPFNHKSSVLCPKSTHFTSQYLALEQIEAHRKMVSQAKHNLDMSAPKSMKSYLSIIDRRKKSFWSSGTNKQSTFNGSTSDLNLPHNILRGDDKIDEDKATERTSLSLNKSIQTGDPYSIHSSKIADKISWYLEALSLGEFPDFSPNETKMKNAKSIHYGSHTSLSSSLKSRKIIKGDIIEWHKDHFTSQQNSFSPRILANNATKSKIKNMRCYNPPIKKESGGSSDTFESDEEEDSDVGEESAEKSSDIKDVTSDVEKEPSVKMRESSADHQNWLSDQAVRAEIRQEFNKMKNAQFVPDLPIVQGKNNKHFFKSIANLNKNEEDNYLKFLIDVTEDILRSGIYSDRAIQQTFEFHLQFCPQNTNKEKLKYVLDQMLEGLKTYSNEPENTLNEKTFTNENNALTANPENVKNEKVFNLKNSPSTVLTDYKQDNLSNDALSLDIEKTIIIDNDLSIDVQSS